MFALNRRQLLLATAATCASPVASSAAGFPERPVKIIVPYGAGGSGYVVLRMLQSKMEKALNQSLVIEARPGGGGNIGAQAVRRSAPDGETLLLGATNNFVINQFLFKHFAYDPLKAFSLITRPAIIPSVLYTNASVPARTLEEFIAYAKANPGKLNYGSPSVGTTPHLAVERLKQVTGMNIVHVPFRGSPQAMQALLSNTVQLYLAGYGVGRAFVKQGKVRMLAVAWQHRLKVIPDVPTVIESGVPGFTAANWWGFAAPQETPPDRIKSLYDATEAAVSDQTYVERLNGLGFLPGHETPQEFLESARSEAKVWAETIKKAHLSI